MSQDGHQSLNLVLDPSTTGSQPPQASFVVGVSPKKLQLLEGRLLGVPATPSPPPAPAPPPPLAALPIEARPISQQPGSDKRDDRDQFPEDIDDEMDQKPTEVRFLCLFCLIFLFCVCESQCRILVSE
jgi:hypothetical protein